jgi:hypothetical protein
MPGGSLLTVPRPSPSSVTLRMLVAATAPEEELPPFEDDPLVEALVALEDDDPLDPGLAPDDDVETDEEVDDGVEPLDTEPGEPEVLLEVDTAEVGGGAVTSVSTKAEIPPQVPAT